MLIAFCTALLIFTLRYSTIESWSHDNDLAISMHLIKVVFIHPFFSIMRAAWGDFSDHISEFFLNDRIRIRDANIKYSYGF